MTEEAFFHSVLNSILWKPEVLLKIISEAFETFWAVWSAMWVQPVGQQQAHYWDARYSDFGGSSSQDQREGELGVKCTVPRVKKLAQDPAYISRIFHFLISPGPMRGAAEWYIVPRPRIKSQAQEPNKGEPEIFSASQKKQHINP